MKTQDEIENRVRALLVAELDRRVELARRRLPGRCVYNHRQEIDYRPRVEGEPNPGYNRVDRRHLPVVPTLGFCRLGMEDPEHWDMRICEDASDAQQCPTFTPMETKESIWTNLVEDLAGPAWIRENMPELYGLLWVLDTDRLHQTLPWWKRLWFRFLRIRLEPVAPGLDLTRMLPLPTKSSEEGGADGISSL